MKPLPGTPEKFSLVLQKELEQIAERRAAAHVGNAGTPGCEPAAEDAVRQKALDEGLVGLAFSGGGIRSATFNLGILQALADFGLLKHFDYLSTVSGGGFIGSWLAAWIKRDGSLDNVEKQLKTTRTAQANAARTELIPTADGIKAQDVPQGETREAEPETIAHLRAHSNYLSPRLGLFSADVWVLGAIYLRNLLLNQAALLPAILFIMLLVRWVYWAFLRGNQAPWREHAEAAMAVVALCLLSAFGWIIYSLWRIWDKSVEKGKVHLQMGSGMLHLFVLLPLVLAAVCTCRVFASLGLDFWSAFIRMVDFVFAPLESDSGMLWGVAIVYPAAAFLLQCGAAIRFIWTGRTWTWLRFSDSIVGAFLWLVIGGLFAGVGMIVYYVFYLQLLDQVMSFVMPLLFDNPSDWRYEEVGVAVLFGVALGLFIAVLHVLAYLLFLLIKSHQNQMHSHAQTDPFGQVWEEFEIARLVRWFFLGLLTGIGAVLLWFVILGLREWALSWLDPDGMWARAIYWCAWVGLLNGFAHLYYLCFVFVRYCQHLVDAEKGVLPMLDKYKGAIGMVACLALIGVLLGIVCFNVGAQWFHDLTGFERPVVAALCVLGIPIFLTGVALCIGFPTFREIPWWLAGSVLAGMFGGLMLFFVGFAIEWHVTLRNVAITVGHLGTPFADPRLAPVWLFAERPNEPFAVAMIVVFGPPAILGIIMLMIALEIGLLSRYLPESAREWLGSLGGWVMIYMAVYVILFGVVIFGGWAVMEAGPYVQGILGAGWLTAAIGGVLAGHSPRTGSSTAPSRLDLVARIAPYIFLIGLLFLVSMLTSALVDDRPDEAEVKKRVVQKKTPTDPPTKVTKVYKFGVEDGVETSLEEHVYTNEHIEESDRTAIRRTRFWEGVGRASPWTIGGWAIACGLLTVIMAWRVDVNIFALSALYRNRLVRCYLGASRAKPRTPDNPVLGAPIHSRETDPLRQPNPITGMDASDDISLRKLAIAGPAGPEQNSPRGVPGGALTIGATYYYVITAVTPLYETAWSNQEKFVAKSTHQSVELSWSAFAGATHYRIYRSDKSGVFVSPALVAEVAADKTTYRDDGGISLKEFQHYTGPYVLINAALNHVAADNLAWQERKAESFVFTPLYCGSASTGYQPLLHDDLGSADGAAIQKLRDRLLTIGRAVTVSGAAASPNMGYHSSPAVTALMTVFNARLGSWVNNPADVGPARWLRRYLLPRWPCCEARRHRSWAPTSPLLGLLYLGAEMFGFTGARASHVYLSDGGHFENLGVYELVRRRCRFIVACDAGADPAHDFEDLAGMIRKCRTDFGIRIEIDVGQLRPEGPRRHCRWHCAIGLIRYDDVDHSASPGILVYIKSSLTGDEPSDVQNYAAANTGFPHEATLDQFFSESQFESYRALGQHIAQKVFSDAVREARIKEEEARPAGGNPEGAPYRKFAKNLFAALHRRWFPPPPGQQEEFLDSVKAFVDVQNALRTDEALPLLSESLYPEFKRAGAVPAVTPAMPGLHMVAQMLQAMESAWLAVHLDGYHALPMNRGWMSVFRRWSNSAAFREYWPFLRGEFSQDFVRFCERQLALRTEKARAVPVDPRAWRAPLRGLLQNMAQEWKDVPRFRAMTATGPSSGLSPFVWKADVIKALGAAAKAVSHQSPRAAKILNFWVNNAIGTVKRMPATWITGNELTRALQRCKDQFDRRWHESLHDLIQLQSSLSNMRDDDLVRSTELLKELDAFALKLGARWPKRRFVLRDLRRDHFKLDADMSYVEAVVARKAVTDWRTALDALWADAMAPWEEMIAIARPHGEHIVPVQPMKSIRSILQSSSRSFERWSSPLDGLRDRQNILRPALGRLRWDKDLPLSALRVRKVLARLQRTLAANLPAKVRASLSLQFIQRVEKELGLQPRVWLIPAPRQTPGLAEWSADEYPCGLICVLPESSSRSEILIWLRGPYRNLGIGRECLDRLDSPLEEIWRDQINLARRDGLGGASANPDDAALRVRYPNGNLPGSSDKLERAIWLSFFFDYEFRRQKVRPDAKPELDLILERRVGSK